jgi:putative membrane protein
MVCAQWFGPHLHWFWVIPLVFMILMLVFAVFMIRRMGTWRWGDGRHHGWGPFGWWDPGHAPVGRWSETPRQILDRRYASGEITKEQYDQMKRDIDPGQSGA